MQLVPCDYKYFLKIWKNSIRQKLKKRKEKTDGRRQAFHLFTAFYLLFKVIKKRLRAARTTFCRLSAWCILFQKKPSITALIRKETIYFIVNCEK